MKESYEQKVPRSERMKEVLAVLEQGTNKENPLRYSISPLMRYMAEQIQLAYMAGARSNQDHVQEIANDYAKLKGFLI
jgi:hypothetical protein